VGTGEGDISKGIEFNWTYFKKKIHGIVLVSSQNQKMDVPVSDEETIDRIRERPIKPARQPRNYRKSARRKQRSKYVA
jgi:hypothetical protein